LNVLETISLKNDFYIDEKDLNNIKKEYITLINCHYNKGGFLIEYLCNNLNINIPLLLVYTENDPDLPSEFIQELINNRNKKNNINILIIGKIEIKEVYKKTAILLTPSLCDETFCRVAYEGMINNIPILSTRNGNLKYLLKDYAIYIDSINPDIWKNEIERVYSDNNILFGFKNNCFSNNLSQDVIEKKMINILNNIKESKYKLNYNNIGLIVPWADQGLGIQSRDYYISLKELGYNPHILSFKPYHATHSNIYLQTNRDEWNYKNIVYSSNYREDLSYDEVIDFIYKYNIKTIIIIEATFINIFKIALFLKLLNIKIYLVINIECIRLVELKYHNIFDKILTNNYDSYNIISQIFKDKTYYLGFHLNYPYFQKIEKQNKKLLDKIKFCCMGGLNSISRKNIDLVIKSFYNIYCKKTYLDWELNIYIQGVEVPDIINKYSCDNIIYNINNYTYNSIIDKYNENDIFIHLGSHEGLGLGFYESLYCGTPIITIDWTPNNEIIKDYINGWIINCDYDVLYDNSDSLIHRGILNEYNLSLKINEVLENKQQTLDIINNTIDNKKFIYNNNKVEFEKNLIDILL
jgi:glycosyltransferase involved in cell wall biosynthesis